MFLMTNIIRYEQQHKSQYSSFMIDWQKDKSQIKI